VVSGVTVYKVEFTENATNEGTPYSVSATGWVDSNGNVLAFYFEGQNITGPQAESDFFTFSSAFYVQAIFTSEFQFFLNAAGVTSSTTSVTLGPTTMQVTDYQASSLPLTISACGYSFTLTSFSLEAGTIPGSSVNVVVYLNMAGTQTSSSSNVSVDMVVKVTSLTKA